MSRNRQWQQPKVVKARSLFLQPLLSRLTFKFRNALNPPLSPLLPLSVVPPCYLCLRLKPRQQLLLLRPTVCLLLTNDKPIQAFEYVIITSLFLVNAEIGGTEATEDEIRVEETANDSETVEEGRDVVERESFERAEEEPLMDFDEGEDIGLEYEREEQDDLGLVTEASNDQLERINQVCNAIIFLLEDL